MRPDRRNHTSTEEQRGVAPQLGQHNRPIPTGKLFLLLGLYYLLSPLF